MPVVKDTAYVPRNVISTGQSHIDEALAVGGLVNNCSYIITGGANSGKSTWCLQTMNNICQANSSEFNGVYFSGEMDEQLFITYAQRMNCLDVVYECPEDDIAFWHLFNEHNRNAKREGKKLIIVLDSLNHFAPTYTFQWYNEFHHQMRLNDVTSLVIAQVTATGNIRGGTRMNHKPEVIIEFEINKDYEKTTQDRTCRILKNRMGTIGKEVALTLTDKGFRKKAVR
jgi:predicted ATP-dependent serine protease